MSITSVVNLAAEKIGELLVDEAKFLYGVDGQVQSLQEKFQMVESFLKDMDAMNAEEEGDERSRTAIKQIRKIAYDAEDVIESYILEVASPDNKEDHFFRRYLCFCSSLPRTHQLGCEIEAIKERINETMGNWDQFMKVKGMGRVDVGHGASRTRVRKTLATYPHTLDNHVVVGLDEDINKLVGVLTDRKHSKIKVVSMVGMGGSGKTTLARKLYNHESVKKQFACFAWVSVSQQWDAQQIILNLLKEVKGKAIGINYSSFSHEVLVGKVYEHLKNKSFLIVLDDVWESDALKEIRPALPIEGDGSKIIVTTRNGEVVNYPDLKPITYFHEPRRLTEQESWELFRKIALVHREEDSNSVDIGKLEELGKKMLKKCRGLRLAVIALAGILIDKENLEEWKKVSMTVSSRIMEEDKGTLLYGPVNQMLALSYFDLPPELKPCFLYLARYKEDSYIRFGELVQLWIAEGFITSAQPQEGKTLEDVARRYLDKLVHRCLVLVAEKNYEGKVKVIQIHDLVRDLCIRKAKEEDFLETCTHMVPTSKKIESHRAILRSQDSNAIPFPTDSHHIRTIIYEFLFYERDNRIAINLQLIQQNFRLLRVLILMRIESCDGKLPVGIESLIHLRYLALVETTIKELPSSIGNLRNLRTLQCTNYSRPKVLLRIPDVLWKLERLMHLYLWCFKGIVNEGRALKVHTLKFLQTLRVGSIEGVNLMLDELPRLSPSVRKLRIEGKTSQEQLEAAFQCPSITQDCLHSFSLSWGDEGTLESLEPILHCRHLRKLTLIGRMRDGVGIQFPTSITKVVLGDTRLEAEAMLVALGKLPHLTRMRFYKDVYMGKQWTCSVGEFPHLKELDVGGFKNMEEWSIERGAMPQLTQLTIRYCKLRKLPEGLKFITTLQHLNLDKELKVKIKRGEEDAHIIQHIPRLVMW